MTDRISSRYKPEAGSIPHAPGVYRFLDSKNEVIYVGKAKFLDQRLSNYFADPEKLHPRTRKMVETATDVIWALCASESEALVLEQNWIHQWRPRFNVAMKNSDTKYPQIAVTSNEEVPRVMPWRGERKKGIRFYGPYPGTNTRELMDALLRSFPMRSCNQSVYGRAKASQRPCLLGDIGKCSAPCVGRVSASEHRKTMEELCSFLEGEQDEVTRRLKLEMEEAAQELDFEKAARRRDEWKALEKTFEKQKVVQGGNLNADALAVKSGEGARIGLALVSVRKGNITGVRTWTTEKDPLLSDDERMTQILGELYAKAEHMPPLLLVEKVPQDYEAIVGLALTKGVKLKISVPKSGARLEVLGAALRNAQAAFESGVAARKDGIEERSKALEEIGEAIGVGMTPWRMECMDIAHISGTDPVASLVVFEDGKPNTAQYRRFNVSAENGGDDFESMKEALRKRFDDKQAGLKRRPDLLVLDGGPGQVAAALQVLGELGVTDVAICGLAKRLEEIWLPGEDQPVILRRSSGALLLLQHLRDEAHRVANTSHRRKREKRALMSELDHVRGLGPAKRQALLKTFGTVEAIASASVVDLESAEGVGPSLAKEIHSRFHPGAANG